MDPNDSLSADPRSATPLGQLAQVFLKLGTTAFGGPAAHIALMEDEVVRRRGWLTREAFLDYVRARTRPSWPSTSDTRAAGGRGCSWLASVSLFPLRCGSARPRGHT